MKIRKKTRLFLIKCRDMVALWRCYSHHLDAPIDSHWIAGAFVNQFVAFKDGSIVHVGRARRIPDAEAARRVTAEFFGTEVKQ